MASHGASQGRPIDVNQRQRRDLALQLRIAGHTQAEIARRIGVGQPQVSRLIKQALNAHEALNVSQLRELQGKRLDSVLEIMVPLMREESDPQAARVIISAEERRARLMGLDLQPERDDAGRWLQIVLYVGVDEAVGPERTNDVVEAAQSAALASVGPQTEAPRLWVRLYPGVDVGAV